MRDYLNLYTHDGLFHADDVFATAMLSLICEDYQIVRGPDTTLPENKKDWIIFDIGGGELDHHSPENKEANGCHPNSNVPYASCGLVWKKFHREILEEQGCPEEYINIVYQRLENSLVLGIDAEDNGCNLVNDLLATIGNISEETKEQINSLSHVGFTLTSMIKDFNPPWNSNVKHDDAFNDAVSFARDILLNRIDSIISSLDGRDYILSCIDYSSEHIMILREFAPWEGVLYSQKWNPKANDIWYVVFPALRGGYNVQCALMNSRDRKDYRHPFPESWYGLRYEELEQATGIKGSVFCHVSGFLAGCEDEASAIALARLACSK